MVDGPRLLLHKKLPGKLLLEYLRGCLQRCGVAPAAAGAATYNKLRRFLPTGANVLAMPDSEAQAIGSWVELPKGGKSGERGKKQERMAVRYSGQRVLSSNEAKQRVLTALLRHPRRRVACRTS